MEYNQDIADKMLADPRWAGAITAKMLRVWKTRGVIPNQYFNPKYVKSIKEGSKDLANQVKDPFYNENFILKTELSDAEKKEHKRILKVIWKNEKINALEIARQTGVGKNQLADASREASDPRFVYLRSEHLLALKKNLQELRIKIKVVVEKLQDKKTFWERDKAEIQALLNDNRLFVFPILNHKTYYERWHARGRGKMQLFEDAEAAYIIEQLAVFLLETGM